MALSIGHSGAIPIDLLPEEIRTEQHARRLLVGLGAAGIGLLVLFGVFTVLQRSQISSAKGELAQVRSEATQLRSETSQLSRFDVLDRSVQDARRTLGTALAGDVAWSRFLTDLDAAMPPGTQLTSLNSTVRPGNTALGQPAVATTAFQGTVPSFPGLSGWLTKMGELEGLDFVYLNSGAKSENGLVTFNANAYVVEYLLSNRCQDQEATCP